jgi:hypothetical protein
MQFYVLIIFFLLNFFKNHEKCRKNVIFEEMAKIGLKPIKISLS